MKIFRFYGWNSKEPSLPKRGRLDFESFNNLSEAIVTEIVRNAEVRFDSTVDDINRIRDISYKLLTVFISLISILVTLYFSDTISLGWVDKKAFSLLYLINIVIVLYCIFQLVSIAIPSDRMLKGEEPLEAKYDNLFSLSHDDQNLNWSYNTVHALQTKIDFNDVVINTMNNRLENVITTSTITFFLTLIISIISQLC